MMMFTTIAVEPTAAMTIMLQEILTRILMEVLTTMLLPCTSVQGKRIISYRAFVCNSTLLQRVLKMQKLTNNSRNMEEHAETKMNMFINY